uniref:hypothetical protein n=1 Tax=Streptomyces albus TaxID=1888 RepID=UPI0006E343A4
MVAWLVFGALVVVVAVLIRLLTVAPPNLRDRRNGRGRGAAGPYRGRAWTAGPDDRRPAEDGPDGNGPDGDGPSGGTGGESFSGGCGGGG